MKVKEFSKIPGFIGKFSQRACCILLLKLIFCLGISSTYVCSMEMLLEKKYDLVFAVNLEEDNTKAMAYAYLAEMLYEGEGCEVNYNRSREYCILAMQQSVNGKAWARAVRILGEFYRFGSDEGVNEKEAFKCFQLGAEQSYSLWVRGSSLLRLGGMYYCGMGCEIDYLKARDYYMRAAEQTDNLTAQAEALLWLGDLYALGHGVDKDYEKAHNSYQSALSCKNCTAAVWVEASLRLGDCYRLGRGCEKDSTKAFAYYKAVADRKKIESLNFQNTELQRAIARGDLARIDELIIADGSLIEAFDEKGNRPLHLAVLNGQYDVVKKLIAFGAQVNAHGEMGNTPLHMVTKTGNTAIAQLLLDSGADAAAVNDLEDSPSRYGRTIKYSDSIEILLASAEEQEYLKNRGYLPRIPYIKRTLVFESDEPARSSLETRMSEPANREDVLIQKAASKEGQQLPEKPIGVSATQGTASVAPENVAVPVAAPAKALEVGVKAERITSSKKTKGPKRSQTLNPKAAKTLLAQKSHRGEDTELQLQAPAEGSRPVEPLIKKPLGGSSPLSAAGLAELQKRQQRGPGNKLA